MELIKLQEGKFYSIKQIAKWFGMTPNNLKYSTLLSELNNYCTYTDRGSRICIDKIYRPYHRKFIQNLLIYEVIIKPVINKEPIIIEQLVRDKFDTIEQHIPITIEELEYLVREQINAEFKYCGTWVKVVDEKVYRLTAEEKTKVLELLELFEQDFMLNEDAECGFWNTFHKLATSLLQCDKVCYGIRIVQR